MSFLPVNQENQEAPTGQTTNAPSAGTGMTAPPPQSGGSAGAGQAKANAAGAANGSPTQFGSSASKLGDYLTANAPQITQQATNVATGLNNQYGQVQGDINNAVNQFGQSVAGGYTAPNTDLVNQAAANPTDFVNNPANISGFQSQYNDQYTGPASFQATTPYSSIQNEVGQAVQNAGLLSTPTGLQNYLAGQNGGNQTQASNTLDQLLLSGNPQAAQTVANAANQFQGLTGQFGNATQQANQGVTAAQQAAQNAAQYAQNTFNPVATNFNTGLQNQLAADQAAIQNYDQSLGTLQGQANQGRSALLGASSAALAPADVEWGSGGQGFQDQLATQFAPNTGAYDAIINTPMNQENATLANTANVGQYNEANALAQLLGTNYTSPLNQANVAQAGGYQTPAALPNLTGATADAAQQQKYLNDLSAFYSNPKSSGIANEPIGAKYGTTMLDTPQQGAQNLLNQYNLPDSGTANTLPQGITPAYLQAVQNLANGEIL